MDSPDDRQLRARARASWAGALVRLDESPDVEVVALPPDRLVALVTELTRLAWAMRGASIPDYERAATPGRVIRKAAAS